jgi:GcrA cell cycle regulator
VASISWTVEHDAALDKYLQRKFSFSQAAAAINKEFGTAYTRNAAIGRANRIGLKSICPPTGGLHVNRKPRSMPWAAQGVSQRTYYRRRKQDVSAYRCVEVAPLNLSLVDLDSGQCHWPYGDGPFTFCGHPQLPGFSYCGPHYVLSIGTGTVGEQNALKLPRAA